MSWTPVSMQDLFVGRQPIYGRDLEVFAYELLYRGAYVDYADFTEGDRATSQVLLNTFTELGMERVVGEHLAFVNLTRGFVVGDYPIPVPNDRAVLEILEDVPADDEVLAGMRRLKSEGFVIALDDFELTNKNRPMLPLADIVKLDVQAIGPAGLRRRVDEIRPFGCHLLAEKIETRPQFRACLDLGFDFFQGFFLSRPDVVHGASIKPSRLHLIRLLSELQNPGCGFDRVQEIVSQDVTMSYKLLRHINSALYGLPRRIDSVHETVVYLGMSMVRNLASLFLLSEVEESAHEQVVTAMLRGRMCEELARAAGIRDVHSYFTVGLFSALDALMNAPMSSILANLPLNEELEEALLHWKGSLGEALAATIAYERGEWGKVSCFNLSAAKLRASFLAAVDWVEAADQELSGMAA